MKYITYNKRTGKIVSIADGKNKVDKNFGQKLIKIPKDFLKKSDRVFKNNKIVLKN